MSNWSPPPIWPQTPRRRQGIWNYPRPYRTGIRAWVPSWRFVVGALLTGTSLVAGVLIAAWVNVGVPGELNTVRDEATTVYYSDGKPIGKFAAQDRTIVPLDELPPQVTNAIISSEDQSFRSHMGINPLGIVRATLNNVTGGDRQGASTLTQQYVENYYVGVEYATYATKLREAIIALKVTQQQSKDQVLEGYVNTIYLGRGAYGVEAASQAYFGHPAKEMTISESAFLAGIIPNPTYWDPRQGEDAEAQAKARWERTLNLMVEQGYITEQDRAAAEYPELVEYKQGSGDNKTAYLMEQVAKELAKPRPEGAGISEDRLATSGFEIHTSIDRKMQAAAYETMKLPEDANDDVRASLTSIDPQTGEIKAMYGGPNYSTNPTNAATFRAQGASTFKPFTLIGALEQDIPLTKRYTAVDGTVIEGWKQDPDGPDVPLYNFENQSWSSLDLAAATADSVNVVYGQLNKEIGPETTAQVGYDLGIPKADDDPDTNDCCSIGGNLANVLGTAYVTNVDLAHAYSTIAAQGYRTTPHLVTKVMNGEDLIHEGSTTRQQMFDEEVMAAATYAMTKVVEDGSGAPAQDLLGPDGTQRPVAGKTGSSNDNMSAWFAGFVPQLTTVVGLYEYDIKANRYEQIKPFGGYEQITGGSWPVMAWTDYMAKATEGMEIEEFPQYTPPAPPEPTQSPSPSISPSEETEEEKVMVPTGLVGQQYPVAASAIAGAGLVSQQVPVDSDQAAGTVLAVDREGQEVEPGETIRVEVSNGSQVEEDETTTVPWGLTNQDRGYAEGQLQAADLSPVVQEQPSDTVPEGKVVAVDPGEGSEVPVGSEVTLVVSTGPEGGGGEPSDDPSDDGNGIFR
ncbi:transglycosylase domain-containing protein [Promicromonospora iranensis]|uniref:Membrane peptidoglycan carboxypeptidase n=1 Tax=Promicromonospora iranensis TaxID=1105144 RepID=A0ABU2CP97_9MICO|nr:transglycosylase domain-containing protein [Promicromonospora iranensis]MDR7383171.1 membrane peptidoglycan carboxypeptidase [Promicromonospora iranensis]